MEPADGRNGARRPGRPRDARVDEVIVGAACAVLADQGAVGFTVDAVAARAGVGKATIYRRWPSRSELLLAAAQEAAMEVDDPDTGSVRDDLIILLTSLNAKLRQTVAGRMLPSVIAEAAVNPELHELLPRFVERRRRVAYRVVERGIARGELPQATDPAMVLDMAGGPIFVRHLLTHEPVDEALIAATVARVLQGFAA